MVEIPKPGPKNRPKSGRPASDGTPRPKGGKGFQIISRVSPELREALIAEAERRGESMSRVIERWLDDARRGFAGTSGLASAEGLNRMIRFSRLVEEKIGDPTVVPKANSALVHGLHVLVGRVAPLTLPDASDLTVRIGALNELMAALAKGAKKPSLIDPPLTADSGASFELRAATVRKLAKTGPVICRDLAQEVLQELKAVWRLSARTSAQLDEHLGVQLAQTILKSARSEAQQPEAQSTSVS